MKAEEFVRRVNGILAGESIDLSAMAADAGVNRSYLSKVINSKGALKVGPKVMSKLKRKYPGYFQENNKSGIPAEFDPRYVALLERDRDTFESIIAVNLTALLETVRTIGSRQEADEAVILESLARLEGKPENQLFQDAGRRKSQIEADARKHGRLPAGRTKRRESP